MLSSFNIEKKDYEAVALSIVKALETVLPPSDMTADVREGWFATAIAGGDFIVESYDEVKIGVKYSGWKKSGGKWRIHTMRLTHQKLLFFKEGDDDTCGKSKDELDLVYLESCDVVHEDIAHRPTESCIGLEVKGGEVIYICVPTTEVRQVLLDGTFQIASVTVDLRSHCITSNRSESSAESVGSLAKP